MDSWTPFLKRVVVVANRKGGVLKSSFVRSVASEAARAGYRVGVLDGDAQGNVSKIDFGLDGEGWEEDRGRSLAMALQYGTDLVPVESHGVDVVCGGPELHGASGAAEAASRANTGLDITSNLRSALGRLIAERQYDLVLIDTAPGETNLLDTYLRTAKWLVVPVVSGDDASLDAVNLIGSRYVDLIRTHQAEVELLGAVSTLVNPKATVRNRAALDELSDSLGSEAQPFEATIRYDANIRTDSRKYGLSAAEVADKAHEMRRRRLAALQQRTRDAKVGQEHSDARPETARARLDDPNEPWLTRDGSGIAGDYRQLTVELLTRIGRKEAEVA